MKYTVCNLATGIVSHVEEITPEDLQSRINELYQEGFVLTEKLCTEPFAVAKFDPITGTFENASTPEQQVAYETSLKPPPVIIDENGIFMLDQDTGSYKKVNIVNGQLNVEE